MRYRHLLDYMLLIRLHLRREVQDVEEAIRKVSNWLCNTTFLLQGVHNCKLILFFIAHTKRAFKCLVCLNFVNR